MSEPNLSIKIYLDNCCYNRPFDQHHDNINYTEWRKTELSEPNSIEDLNRQASAYFKQKRLTNI